MIPFVKAHACGNDFLLVEEQFAGADRAAIARKLCDRNTGIGSDGVEWIALKGDTVRAVLSNADGSIAEISGNGTRCVAAWLAHQRKIDSVAIVTDAGTKLCRVLSHEGQLFRVETGMGVPDVALLTVGEFAGVSVSMGNPHFVILVDEYPQDWVAMGARLANDAAFSQGTNVEFVRIVGANRIEFRIYERGAGPTLSSGTGSCASAVAAMFARQMPRELHVVAQGGEQFVRWEHEVFLTGPAQLIARGEAWL